jgi:hypothetical protein
MKVDDVGHHALLVSRRPYAVMRENLAAAAPG